MRTPPREVYAPGEVVLAEFSGDDPRGPARDDYLLVEQRQDGGWQVVADDADWATTVRWRRDPEEGWVAAVTWRIPLATAGTHRVAYLDREGTAHPTPEFVVQDA